MIHIERSNRIVRGTRRFIGFALMVIAALPAAAQLDQNCIVSVLNRNVSVNADGSWVLPNVPANFGQVRARATCVENGVTTSGQSDYFTLPANGTVNLPHIQLGNSTAIPTSITLTAPSTNLTGAGQTLQLTVTATYSGGGTANVTGAASGTTYTVSNPAIASLSPNGLVTGLKTGTALVQATNEGAQGLLSINVVLNGLDSDGDGIPDDAEIRLGLNPNDPTDALLDLDHDGLTNLEEYRLGTDLRNPDTDGDGISDGDEVHGRRGFVTNPLLADTDGDGINDLTEINTGSDPTNPNSVNLSRALSRMDVMPPSFTLIVNSLNPIAAVQLSVLGRVIDGTTIDLTSTTRGTRYSSSDLNICNFGSPDGRVFAGSPGGCTITVTNGTFTQTVTGSVTNFSPTALSFVAIPGYANSVAVSGDYAFVAAGASGLQVVSLSQDRVTPVVVGSRSLAGNANDVTIVGTRAYVAAGSAGLHVLDISNPVSPNLLGTFATNGNAMDVTVRGSTAFVANGSNLTLVNVSNPAAMILISSLSLSGTVWGVDVDTTRNLAVVAARSGGVYTVDIANPASPQTRGNVSTGDAREVAIRGNFVIVADQSTSMNSVDITTLTAPVVRSTTDVNLGGRLNDVVLAGTFAIGADIVFVNGVPFVDINDPTHLQPRAILNFPQRDDNGMGIAVDNAFVYLATEHSGFDKGGSTGDSRLYIGQYLPRQDLAGSPPNARIISPLSGVTQYQGAFLTVSVDATDDVAVASVDFLVNGQVAFTSTSTPYQYSFTVPLGINSLVLGARATDLGGNVGTAPNVTVPVMPDPLTLVTGLVVTSANVPVSGAAITAPGGLTGITGPDGRFSIAGVPTVLGNIFINATFTPANQSTLTGTSASVPPVLGGVTNVGTITLIPAAFITNYGTLISRCDDCSFSNTLPFSFPFYGVARTTAFVGTNGYITFNQGDSTYTESLPAFNTLPRIAAFFDDLYAGPSPDPTAGLYVNDQIPGQFVVTYLATPHYPNSGPPNTLQIQLFQDGRIIFAYNGITSLNSGTVVGLTPGPNAPSQAVDYSVTRNTDVPAGTAVYEYFNGASLFDLDQGFIIYTPNTGGGYNVRTLLQTTPQLVSVVTGGPAPQVRALTATATPGLTAKDLAKAEVLVTSSTDPKYRGMTNTDASGNFTLRGVPAGGIFVEVRRKGKVIGQGGGVFPGGALTTQRALSIQLSPPQATTKTAPHANP